jgi:rod shape-determining protein MreC
MEFFLSRYRNLTVLLIAIAGQLLLIAYQVKSNRRVPMLRVWAVSAVTPAEQGLEFIRRYTWGFVEDYFVLLGVRGENDKLKHQNGQLKLENNYLKSELSTADRARALSAFQATSPSKMLAARITGNGTGANSKTVFVDRGSASGVESGMAVVTPDGIVGKVLYAYPLSSLVMLITDGNFGAGVISQKNRVRGTLKGVGHSDCQVDYVQNEERVDAGEWFFTSGDDRIFPKGFPVGQVNAVRAGKTFKEIYVTPSGLQGGLEEVLIVLQGAHQQIPDGEIAAPGYKILPAPPEVGQEAPQGTGQPAVLSTDADRLREQYKQAGDTQHHAFGDVGSTTPDFTKIQGIRAGAPPPPTPPRKPETAPNATAGTATPGTAAPNTNTPSPKPGSPDKTASTAPPVAGAKPPVRPPVAKAQPDAIGPVAPPKPRPRTPILVTDPTDADPGGDAIPPPKPDKPASGTKQQTPPPRPPNQ